ncbi:MAG: 6-phosphogluconolactonase [Candidatus Heimdallarchaeota archaeon]|nr:6-phosphogluconolactonase [Candidatus Heimdallarchaeota archaeon]
MKIIVEKDESLAETMSKDIIALIIKLFIHQEKVILALSGGSTPQKMYQILGKYLKVDEIVSEYSQISIIQVDERFSNDNQRLNQLMIQKALNIDTKRFIDFYPIPTPRDTQTAELASNVYENTLDELIEDAIDILILGMGTDGHTASLFPNNAQYIDSIDANNRVIWADVEVQGEHRISLSASMIGSAKNIFILITGDEKGLVLRNAINSQNRIVYPILLGLNENTTIYMDPKCFNAYGAN